jgi:glycosyltransferase involved in cell wall biosynthesis
MNILHVIDSGGMYGAEVVLLNLMDAQRDIGLNSSLLSLGNMDSGLKTVEIESINRGLNVKTSRFKDGPNIKGAFEILNIARQMGTDIIHSHGYKGNILLGLLPHRIRNIPVITTIHGWTATRLLSKMKIYEFIDALAMKNLECIVGVSESISSRRMIKYFGIHPVIINNGIKPIEFEKGIFEHTFPVLADESRNKFKVLAIGRLSPEKGFDILIHAVASLVSENIAMSLVIIGEGEEKFRLERLISQLNLKDTVHLIGYLPKAYSYLADFDAFVLSSLTEGLPITILEAMQAEVPIVATRVGEIPVLLENGDLGELVRPNKSSDLSRAIKRVYDNRKIAKESAKKARQKALINYGVENMAMKYHGLYKRITGKINSGTL